MILKLFQVKLLLKLKLNVNCFILQVICFPDEMCYDEEISSDDVKEHISPAKKNNQVMYAVGIICAVGILLISVGVHFLLNSDDDDN